MNRYKEHAWFVFLISSLTHIPACCAYSQLHNWLVKNGAVIQGVDVQDDVQDGIRGLVAIAPLPSNKTITRMPQIVLLSDQLLNSTAFPAALKTCRELLNNETDEDCRLAAVLLIEQRRGVQGELEGMEKESFYRPYLDKLPQEVGLPIGWSSTQQSCLKGTEAQQIHEKWIKDHNASFYRFREACPLLHVTAAEWSWARQIIDSRAFSFDGRTYLVPFGDMLNHMQGKGGPDVEFSMRKNGDLEMRTRREIQDGAEVTTNYGTNRLPREWVLAYGFAPSGEAAGADPQDGNLAWRVSLLLPDKVEYLDQAIAQMKMELFGVRQAATKNGHQFVIGRTFSGSKVSPGNELAKALAHLRFEAVHDKETLRCLHQARRLEEYWPREKALPVVESFAFLNCTDFSCFHLRPMHANNEVKALQGLKEAIEARLNRYARQLQTGLKDSGTAAANLTCPALAQHLVEGEVALLQRHLGLIKFALPVLEMDPEEVVRHFCASSAAFSDSTWRRYKPYVEGVLWPLLLFPGKRGCGVEVLNVPAVEVSKECSRDKWAAFAAEADKFLSGLSGGDKKGADEL